MLERFNNLPKDIIDRIRIIKGDGNCFYRAIAYFLHGDEELFLSIKKLLKKGLIRTKSNAYQTFK